VHTRSPAHARTRLRCARHAFTRCCTPARAHRACCCTRARRTRNPDAFRFRHVAAAARALLRAPQPKLTTAQRIGLTK
jgi:hypothetical protein